MVYYRKYRPQTISELDLPSVREKLANILSTKQLPHAFLFTGSKGLGKTSSARILAKAINCNNKKKGSIEPCNECEVCISITNGSNIDVLEIDAASNGGVEEIRTLRERVKYASSTLTYKVYIIDEVHMLSTGAFNALLKTLEEPPSHVVFILATTELWKLPPTVVSRTFQVLFEKPTPEQIVASLERIVKGEGLEVEKGVLLNVSRLSDGAFRDAAKVMEELALASKGKKITNELFDSTFKTKGISDEVHQLLKAYASRDAKEALAIIARLSAGGADFKLVLERFVDHLRGLLMIRNGIESNEVDVEGLSLHNIKELLELSQEAYSELKLSIIPQLPLELMTVKYCILDREEQGLRQSKPQSIRPGEVKHENKEGGDGEQKKKDKGQATNGRDVLKELIEKVNEINKPAAALLRSCKDATVSDGMLTIETPFPIHADRLKSDKVYPDLKKVAKSLFGEGIELKVNTLR